MKCAVRKKQGIVNEQAPSTHRPAPLCPSHPSRDATLIRIRRRLLLRRFLGLTDPGGEPSARRSRKLVCPTMLSLAT
jgi:hypothetical protein